MGGEWGQWSQKNKKTKKTKKKKTGAPKLRFVVFSHIILLWQNC
jgi:hypothetical protein